MSFPKLRVILLVTVGTVIGIGSAMGRSGYFSANCASCHTNDSETCIGCHHHGGAGGSPGTATTNKTQYAPGLRHGGQRGESALAKQGALALRAG
jgi:hypothetical protein